MLPSTISSLAPTKAGRWGSRASGRSSRATLYSARAGSGRRSAALSTPGTVPGSPEGAGRAGGAPALSSVGTRSGSACRPARNFCSRLSSRRCCSSRSWSWRVSSGSESLDAFGEQKTLFQVSPSWDTPSRRRATRKATSQARWGPGGGVGRASPGGASPGRRGALQWERVAAGSRRAIGTRGARAASLRWRGQRGGAAWGRSTVAGEATGTGPEDLRIVIRQRRPEATSPASNRVSSLAEGSVAQEPI